MLQKNFILYRSSAGSGKTYTLAREYLKLVLQNPDKYKQILAVTFTNKATQEMKDRILHFLNAISVGEGGAMRQDLMLYLKLTDDIISKRAKIALSNILHNYSYFSVSTIDSFFQKIIRTFAREIGLQSGFKLELNLDKVLSEVVEMVLMDIGKNSSLKNWLVQFAREKVDAGKSWDINKDIKELGREIFKEEFKEKEKDILKLHDDPNYIAAYAGKLRNLKKEFESSVKALGLQACSLMKDFDLDVNDFAHKGSGVMGYLENLCNMPPYLPGSRARQAHRNLQNWYSKTSPKKDKIQNAVTSGLDNVLGEVLELFETGYIKYQSANQVLKFMYTYGILANINQKLQEYREEHGLLLISDATAFLKDIIAENDAPFIYEKTGSNYRHFLIDEFQDTSKFQWANFKPLIINSLAEGNPNLVVGDIKQSIYRWRGGDWKLLLEQIGTDIGEGNTQVMNLNTNWRSKKNIIDFNNSLFNTAPQVLSHLAIARLEQSDFLRDEAIRNDLITEAQKISSAYQDVFQALPDGMITEKNFCGYVNMTFIDSAPKPVFNDQETEEESLTWKEEVKQRIPHLLEKIQDQGYSLKDVAILVRDRNEGKQIASCILDYKNSSAREGYSYEVISSEALFITGAISTELLINALRIMNNTNDKIARANLTHDYQRYVLKNEPIALHDLFSKTVEAETLAEVQLLPNGFVKNLEYLVRLPLYELVEELINIFGLTAISGEITYIQSLQDMVLNFMQEEKSDINSFLEYWDDRGHSVSVSISDKLDAAKIITIHKSKGLQFKNVIVPFCDWKTDHNTRFTQILWCDSNISPFNDIRYLPLNYSKDLEQTIYQKAFFEEMVKAQLDYLNILYVAFTRAEESLYAFGEKPNIEKGPVKVKCMSSLLYYIFSHGFLEDKVQIKSKEEQVFSNLNHFWKTEQAVFELGDPDFKCKTEPGMGKVISKNIGSYISEPWRNRLSIKTRTREFFSTESIKKINYGNLMHKVLSRIKTSAQVEGVLNDLYFKGEIDQEDFNILLEQINGIMMNPVVHAWFTDVWEVKTEAPVLPNTGDIKRFDRVMIKENEAIVVDFKSGKPFESHKQQIFDYALLLKEMNYNPVQGYLVYLASGVVEKVV
ncbi:MAG: UvrD-helicase domain-containing protein [Bacteroidota bacterium]|nr:UvrD-helicase domain-containing protein [Bacteroidota bacterium]